MVRMSTIISAVILSAATAKAQNYPPFLHEGVEVDGWDMAGTVDDTLANDRVGCQVRPERLSRSAGPMANGTTCRITRCSGPDRTAFPMLGALARRDRAA
jgi:hypothetical protein